MKSEIRSGFYLGGYEEAVAVGTTKDITHLLTVTSLAPKDLMQLPKVTPGDASSSSGKPLVATKVIPLVDNSHENLIDSLEECLDFIQQGLDHGSVLVHCTQGVSRSVSVVTAFLMRKEHLTLDEALKDVVRLRPQARPNPGFLKQLDIFHSMGCKVDRESSTYLDFRRFYARQLRSAYMQGHNFNPSQFAPLVEDCHHVIKCKACSSPIATRMNSMHDASDGCCGAVFLEPMQWMATQITDPERDEGDLTCVHCGALLGQFSWDELPCNCSTIVLPAFQLDGSNIS